LPSPRKSKVLPDFRNYCRQKHFTKRCSSPISFSSVAIESNASLR
jgi:hypothetical protein